jgi:hypothetical protein
MKQTSTASIIVVGSIVFGLIALSACLLGNGQRAAQAESDATVVVGIDVDPNGNTPTSLGTIDQCISVSSGANFDIDVFLDKVPSPHNLGGFEYRLIYDSTKLQVNAIDHGAGTSLIMSQAGSGTLELGDCSAAGSPCPDTDGSLYASLLDMGSQASAEGPGSLGVLGRYTLQVVGGGGTLAYLTLTDLYLAGFEPAVTEWTGEIDQVWDGDFTPPYGIIAIDTPCPELTAPLAPTATVPATATPAALTATVPATATPAALTATVPASTSPAAPTSAGGGESTSGPGDMPWIAVYAAAGAIVVLLVGALALLRIRRR